MAVPPAIIGVTSNDPKCIGVENGSILISATGTGTILYSIDSGATFQSSNSFTGLPSGTFDIIVQDATGDTFIQVVLTYQQSVTASFVPSVSSGVAILPVSFLNTSVGATSYSWNLDGGTSNSTMVNPTFSYDTPGNFTVTLIAANTNCLDTATAVITVTGISQIVQVPNVFSPNDDGINDVFSISSIGMAEMEVYIYNRYGEIVYQWYGKNGHWDGRTYPAGQQVPTGTYYFYYKATGFDGVAFEDKGVLTLTR